MRGPDAHTDLVLALARARIRPAQISERCGLTPNQVYTRLAYWRRHGVDIPPFVPGQIRMRRRIWATGVDGSVREALALQAAARDMDLAELAGALLSVIARDDLVDAILDDRETTT